jgi:hypothetical protein
MVYNKLPMHELDYFKKSSKRIQEFRIKTKIYKRIGNGKNGVTYLVKYNGIKSVLKHQILKNNKRVQLSIKHEQEFYNWISNLTNSDKIFFMQEYKSMNEILNSSQILVENIIEYKKGDTLNTIIKKVPSKKVDIYRSIMIQLLYIINLMQSHKWFHNDLHGGNVICRRISGNMKHNLYLGPLGISLKYTITKYQVSAIDYGEVIQIKNIDNSLSNIDHLMNSIIFDIDRMCIVNMLGLGLNSTKLPFNVLYRLKKFRKKDKLIFRNIINYIKTSYCSMLNQRAQHLFGHSNYRILEIETFISKSINRILSSIKSIDTKLPKNSWLLYIIEMLIIIKYEEEYFSTFNIKRRPKLSLDKIDLLNLLITPSESEQSNVLKEIIIKANKQ